MQYSAVISLVCKKTVMGNESTFMFVGEIDHPHNTYVSYYVLTRSTVMQGWRNIFLSGGTENERQRREFVRGSGCIPPPPENFDI